MKHWKKISLLSSLLCACTVFSACAMFSPKELSVKELYTENPYVDTTPTLTAASALSIKGTVESTGGELVELVSDTRITVYNYASGTTILELVKNDGITYDVNVVTVDNVPAFSVHTIDTNGTTKKEYSTLYAADGTQIARTERGASAFRNANLLGFHSTYYRVENGTFTVAFEQSPTAKALPSFDRWTDTHYYDLSSEHNAFSVYDRNGNFVTRYEFFADETCGMYVLNNGNVLVQYLRQLPEDAQEYDLYQDGKKWLVFSQIFDLKKDSPMDLETTFLVQSLTAPNVHFLGKSETKGRNERIDNTAVVYFLEGNRLNDSVLRVGSLNNNGKWISSLDRMVQDQQGEPSILSNERFLARTNTGRVLLLDWEGKILGDVSNADINECFLIAGDMIFDHSLNSVLDYSNQGYQLVQIMDRSVILKKGDSLYCVNESVTTPTLLEGSVLRSSGAYSGRRFFYTVETAEDETISFCYYNDCGTLLFRSDSEFVRVCQTWDGSCVFLSDGTSYYRLSK